MGRQCTALLLPDHVSFPISKNPNIIGVTTATTGCSSRSWRCSVLLCGRGSSLLLQPHASHPTVPPQLTSMAWPAKRESHNWDVVGVREHTGLHMGKTRNVCHELLATGACC